MQSTGSGIERATVVIVVGAWLVAIVSVLLHPLFVSHDSISNYAHVWYISREIWTRHRFPLHMSMLAQGHALASPYALVPWTSAALLYPLLGGWVVTLCLPLVSLRWSSSCSSRFPNFGAAGRFQPYLSTPHW